MQHAMHLVVRKGEKGGGDIPGSSRGFVGGVGAGTGKASTGTEMGVVLSTV